MFWKDAVTGIWRIMALALNFARLCDYIHFIMFQQVMQITVDGLLMV